MTARGTSRRIAEDLAKAIRTGELGPGSLIPSEAQLVERFQVSRGTIRSALKVLSDKSLIEVVSGVGRRVSGGAEPPEPSALYEKIAQDLTKRIESGAFDEALQLPSETSLVEEYGVSRNTVRRAYQVLRDAEMIVVVHGSGAFLKRAQRGSPNLAVREPREH